MGGATAIINRKSFIYKGICLLLICLLSVSAFTACQSNQTPEPNANGTDTPTPNEQHPEDLPTGETTSEYALVMLESKAEQLGIVNISDLSNNNIAGTMNVSAPEEAYKGEAILESMQEEYGVYFKNHAVHESGEGYIVLTEGSGDAEIGVALVVSDDPALQKDDVRILKDDKQFFEK